MNDAPIHDPLTGAYTRALLSEQLHTELERALRYGSPCSLMLFDLDHFKSINDAFGHARGDEVLIEVVRRVQHTIRATDQLFRYGGDEFVLVLPNTAKSDATILAERLLEVVRATPIEGTPSLSLTLSIGVATCPTDASVERALLEKADARNYEAKRRGRAQVVAADASAPPSLPFAEVSRLIERDEALEQAKGFLAALNAQKRGVLNINGAVGAGRSRFLAEVGKRAHLQGFAVITLRGARELKTKPYGALSSVLQALFGAPPLRFSAAEFDEALRRHVAAQGRDRLLIGIDDLSYLDWGTIDLLRQILATSALPALGLVCVSDPNSARLASSFHAPVHEHIALHPLSRGGLQVWLRALMQWEPPVEFIDWLAQHTQRLPAQVEQTLTHLLKRGTLAKHAAEWTLDNDYATLGADSWLSAHKPPTPHNLPATLTSFVGREKELVEVRRLLGMTRLLTLVGVGGAGKTRLSLQVAAELLGAFPDGVWFVELAPLTNPALVPQAVATALRMAANPMLPLSAQLADELRAKQMLLILDNCEHLIDASAQLADELLRACPHLRILASSREALDMEGEAIYRVPSLSCPTLDPQLLISHLMQFEAVRLFVERALLVQSNFSVTTANALLVVQICQRLDGIPLALELAAAQLKALAVEQIAAQLDDRFNLLAGGKRTSLPRQQTLRAAIDWSYNLLSASERALFRYLSVFAGSWTLDTAEWVCADDDTETSGRLVSADILGLLTQLVNKSLVVNNEQGNEARYHFLETIRQYARESLLEAGEEVRLRDRHLECFVRLAETAEPQLRTTQITTWLTRLESELDNVRTALDWAAQQARCEQGLRLAAALEYFWAIRDHQAEGGETLRRLLAHPSAAAPTLVRAKALNILSLLRIRVADYAQAETAAHEALAIGRALNDTPTIALTLFALGWRSILQGHYHEAQSLLEQSRSLFRASGSQLHGLRPLLFLGVAAMWLGDYVRAQAVFAELATLEQASGDKSLLSTAIRFWGFALFYQHDYAGASAKFRESLMPNLAFKDTTGITPCLIGYAALAMAYEQFERAVQLLSVVEALVASTHVRLMPYDHTQSTQYITALRAQLSEADFNAAWEAGKKMTLDEAIALALNS